MMMSVSNPIHAVLFLLSIFTISSIKLCYSIQSNSIFCPEIEKHSLLSFKQSLQDPYILLSSWDDEVDCCKWKGVVCNNSTGHVHHLHLQGLSGKINPSLLNLKHLTYLNLSQNDFFGETIPSFIGSFKTLEYLDLSNAGFQGKIPHNIGNLSNLHTLNLGYIWAQDVDSLEWLSGLSKLEYFNMDGVNMSEASNWAKVINSLPSLLEIHLSGCSLDFMSPVNHVNLTSLTLMDLSFNYNYGQSSFPVLRWVFQLNNLLSLDLSGNSFIGSIPTVSNATKLQHFDLTNNDFNSSVPDWLYFCKDLEFVSLLDNYISGKISDAVGNLTSLKSLDLSRNQLSGKLPREITNLCRLQSLDLSYNELQGEVENIFGNMSDCFLGSLEGLRLSGNRLSGHLIDQFGEFKNLQTLYLGSNSLSGVIPINLGNLSSLEKLWLEDNNLTGNLPESLGQLSTLQRLNIQNNKLKGTVSELHFANLSKLEVFSASGNNLTLYVGPNWIPPIQLEVLKLGSWSLVIGSEIPSWLQRQRNITVLDLSNTGISGSIPSWFLGIKFLNVSHNNLHGKIPHINSSSREWDYLFPTYAPKIADDVGYLDLSHNLFSNGISDLLCNTTYNTYRLEFLNLEGNRLSGELPDCWKKWPCLKSLKLGNNRMTGSIPNSIGFLASLRSLSLPDNKFAGQIPFTMQNCTDLVKIDLSHNNLDGHLPTWMGTSLVKLKILILHSNKLSGEISSEMCHLQSLQILDLSNNRFSGKIPRCVFNFTAMATKRNLIPEYEHSEFRTPIELWGDLIGSARVVTKGVELEYTTILSLVTNFDLSSNNLSGEIPKEFTSLVELGSLNLSGNHLTGSIPESIGEMKQLESLDLSRNSLSAQIPNGFTLLYSLNHLNLSFNKLTGRIPESTQLQSLEASSFIGNDLCGPPLTTNCSRAGDEVHGQKEENEDEKSEIEWLYVFLTLGYAVGFSAACTALVVKKSWRVAYFGWLECMWDKLYVFIHVKWAIAATAGS